MQAHWHSNYVAGLLAATFLLCGMAAYAEPIEPAGSFMVDGSFAGPKPNEDATDLSGIACTDRTDASGIVCMAVNDENSNAQFVVLGDGRLRVRSTIDLIADDPDDKTVGTPPDGSTCPDSGGFKEFDGEAVAFRAPYFYVSGSHGCGRNNGKFRLSSFILARIKVPESGPILDENGRLVTTEPVETTYRLSEALLAAPKVASKFAKSLNDDNGLNIEAIAISGDKLIAGLRAPSIDGNAFLVVANLDTLFAAEGGGFAANDAIPVPLGENIGIRDMTALPDGRLLLLAGAAQEQDVPYSVWIMSLDAPNQARSLGELKVEDGKAEAIFVLESGSEKLDVLVLFDGIVDGGPRHYTLVP